MSLTIKQGDRLRHKVSGERVIVIGVTEKTFECESEKHPECKWVYELGPSSAFFERCYPIVRDLHPGTLVRIQEHWQSPVRTLPIEQIAKFIRQGQLVPKVPCANLFDRDTFDGSFVSLSENGMPFITDVMHQREHRMVAAKTEAPAARLNVFGTTDKTYAWTGCKDIYPNCPTLLKGHNVTVRYRSGEISTGPAIGYRWEHADAKNDLIPDCDILEYMIASPLTASQKESFKEHFEFHGIRTLEAAPTKGEVIISELPELDSFTKATLFQIGSLGQGEKKPEVTCSDSRISNLRWEGSALKGDIKVSNEEMAQLQKAFSKVNTLNTLAAQQVAKDAPKDPSRGALNDQVAGNHYAKLKIQPVEFVHANGLDFFQGNMIKYATRHKDKNGVEDLKKVIHYARLAAKLQYDTDI